MRIYRVSFFNHGKAYLLHAEHVSQGDLYGFVEISGLLFGEHTSVVIDPAEEKLADEFAGVNRFMVPMHAIIRIDEVEKRGQNKIMDVDGSGKVTPFPSYGPGKRNSD